MKGVVVQEGQGAGLVLGAHDDEGLVRAGAGAGRQQQPPVGEPAVEGPVRGT